MNRLVARAALLALVALPVVASAQSPLSAEQVARIDSVFARYARPSGAGCAVGVSQRDRIVFERAWGNANLEYNIPITPNTIFEGGSVSKQFTTAAVLLLAQRGKLSLDDDIRKYVPEVPAYEKPITVRHLIHHTSGLRDWGTVMAIAGWPRGTRTYTNAHVIDILSRQRALNYPVGTEYLYSNSNYNLLAIIAERVSGQSLAQFTKTEIFDPLGMTRSGWRDDYTKIVPGRAQAYGPMGGGWRLVMPNENVYGNSSVLTTVGDLLRWSANFGHHRVGGPEFVQAQLRQGRLSTGRQIAYAGGVFVDSLAGTPQISHDGATAGYRAFLGRYPELGYSVSLLCNAADANPSGLGLQVVSIVTGRRATPPVAPRDSVGLTIAADELALLAGNYRSARADDPLRVIVRDGRLRQVDGPALVAVGKRHFTSPSGRTHMRFDPENGAVRRIRVWIDAGDTTDYLPAGDPVVATALGDYTGTYWSDEADVEIAFRVEEGRLVMISRPASKLYLTPIYRDGFSVQGSFIRFTRGGNGNVSGFLATSGRARNIAFSRKP